MEDEDNPEENQISLAPCEGDCIYDKSICLNYLCKTDESYIEPLRKFRIERIGNALQSERKKYEKASAKFYQTLEKHLHTSTTKKNDFKGADDLLDLEQRNFHRASLDYVLVLQSVQERMKFEFVETLSSFLYSWLSFYHVGYVMHEDFKPYLDNVKRRVQKAKESFLSTQAEAEDLKMKMLSMHRSNEESSSRISVKQGYLYLLERKNLVTAWTKHYCVYQKESRMFTMIPFSQNSKHDFNTAYSQNISKKLKSCTRRASDSIDKRFCFDVTFDECSEVLTFQALSEEDRRLWLDSLDGKEPVLILNFLRVVVFAFFSHLICGYLFRSFQIHSPTSSSANMFESLGEQGLYRNCGINSKVNKLLQNALSGHHAGQLDLDKENDLELKTVTSAVKTFFRHVFRQFLNAVKLEDQPSRIKHIHCCVHQLPEPNFRMLKMLMKHLQLVSRNSNKNLMTVCNLGVCFGPCIMRPKEETIAAIMDINSASFGFPSFGSLYCGGSYGLKSYSSTLSRSNNDLLCAGTNSSSSLNSIDSLSHSSSPSPKLPHNITSRSLVNYPQPYPGDLRRVRTLFECVGDDPSELSFLPGQIITNVYPSKEPHWLYGTLNGKVGLVPESFVEALP
ncbi:unnamed protein product [Soboliphyme baturini]|uniref:Rho GTPase-activating protein 10 n=1 Tax=Soboliphyme baturini TaxID=241478 RepID=A0A183IE49_9BILA|nr:unnamed protein product [Soboliphyme baturini]